MNALRTPACFVAALGLLALAPPVSAQAPIQPSADVATPVARGWIFTPSFSYGVNWDDNVLIQGRGEDTRKDLLNAVSPRGALDYRNKRTLFSAAYDGTILLYTQLRDLDAYDQRASVNARHQLSQRYTLFGVNSLAISPTTSLTEVVGAPFVRTGTRVSDTRGGVEIVLSKSASLTGAYTFQWVSFGNPFNDAQTPLRGGHGHGVTGGYRQRLNGRLSLTADYDVQHATIAGASPAAAAASNATGNTTPGATAVGPDTFDVQNASFGLERRESRTLTYSAAIGISRLGLSSTAQTRLGPAWRLGLGRQFERGFLDLGYSRSFVPSYGFGGTVQNEQVTAMFRAPLARRLSGRGSVSWRRNEPLTNNDPSLWSWWIETGLSYRLRPWLSMDAFYATDRQRIDRPGGQIVRNRIGVQFATGRAMRIH